MLMWAIVGDSFYGNGMTTHECEAAPRPTRLRLQGLLIWSYILALPVTRCARRQDVGSQPLIPTPPTPPSIFLWLLRLSVRSSRIEVA